MKSFCDWLTLVILASASMSAQSVAVSQISGIVRDPSGLPVPGAQVTATQTGTGVVRTTQSGPDGAYVMPSLALGPYRLEFRKEGFAAYVQSGIVLQVNTNPSIDVTLKVGSVTEQVMVEAAAAMVETHSTGVGQVVDQQRVVDLPLNGRQATQLIMLAGAAVNVPTANTGQLISNKNYPGEVAISVAGGAANGITYLLDGGTHNDPINNEGLPLPFPDALQEFKVETSALPAQYGQHAAGAVNAVTKSGGNEFQGNAFEFIRNGAFNARDYFAPVRDSLKRNQFGGTLGGPVIKNKLFFFAGYQGTIQRSAPVTGSSFIPTPAMLKGDFTTITSPACNGGRQIALKAPFVNNMISPNQFSPPALKMVSYYGSTSDPCGKVQFGSINSQDEQTGTGRVDYQLSATHTIFGRYYGTHTFLPPTYTGSPLSITATSPDDLVTSVVLGDTYILGPKTINSFRATFARSSIIKTQVPTFGASDLGIVGVTELVPHFFTVTVSGALYNGNGAVFPGALFTTTHQFADDLSLIRGAHQMQFGVNYIRPVSNVFITGGGSGSFSFNGQTTNLSMADFLLGIPASFGQSNLTNDFERHRYIGLYAQDSWRVKPRLVVNYGLRWEPLISATIQHGQVTHFERALFDQNVHSVVYPNGPAGMLFPGDARFDTNSRPSRVTWNDFAPRLGLVWDPKGDGRMTIRASAGMFYDLPNTMFFYSYSSSPPWGSSVSYLNPPGGFQNPWQGYPGGNPFPVRLSQNMTFPAAGSYLTAPLDIHATYLEQWNLSLQKQFGKNWLASANYLGNNTIHAWAGQSLDPSLYIPGATCAINGQTFSPCSSTANSTQRRVLTLANPTQGLYYNSLSQLEDGATASYNALLLSLQHRLANHFTVLGNYTWSHCIADPLTTAIGGSYSVPSNRSFDRGNCGGIDTRYNFNLSAVLESPRFSGPWVQAVAGDWKLSVIGSGRTGSYFAITTGIDNDLNGVAGDRANQMLPNIFCASKNPNCWINGTAFTSPLNGSLSNMSNNSVIGPGYFDIDLGLSRSFRVTEKHRVDIRGEAFNVQNRANFSNPTSALNNTSFGKILSDVSPRIMQLAIKYAF